MKLKFVGKGQFMGWDGSRELVLAHGDEFEVSDERGSALLGDSPDEFEVVKPEKKAAK